MPPTLPLTLRGTEVLLRPLSLEDAPALALATAESRDNYLYNPVPNGLVEARTYVEKALDQQAQGERMPFTILYNGRVVGSTSYSELTPWKWPEGSPLQRTDTPDSVEIGYTWLAASAQRTRVNTEAKYLLLAHAFDIWQVHSVTIKTDERNTRSRRAIERLGAKLEGIRRAHTPGVDGTVRSSAFYSILPTEWPAVRKTLEARLARE